VDNWHDNRDGNYGYAWSHQNSPARRAHDGVDIFPFDRSALPPVYAPFAAQVVDVNVGGQRVRDDSLAPNWDYGQGNIYGNYVWLRSTEADASKGFLAFYCHLQDDPTLRSLTGALVTSIAEGGTLLVDHKTQVGMMGDTGNAANDPQLHMEIHYPRGITFTCARCTRTKDGMTAINPFPSLSNPRPR